MDFASLAKIYKDGFLQFINFTWIEIVIYAIILVPTFYAMIKGAPFVPTQMTQVKRMLSIVPLKKGMKLYDLGSGDGRLVHEAAKHYNVDAVGYEFSPLVWLWSVILSYVWRSKAQLRFGNFWKQNLSDADVIVCYLLPNAMKQMKQRLMPQLKPGALIISHAFQIPDLKAYKSLPPDPDQRIGAVWVYKI